jgi:hypothetical protein
MHTSVRIFSIPVATGPKALLANGFCLAVLQRSTMASCRVANCPEGKTMAGTRKAFQGGSAQMRVSAYRETTLVPHCQPLETSVTTAAERRLWIGRANDGV